MLSKYNLFLQKKYSFLYGASEGKRIMIMHRTMKIVFIVIVMFFFITKVVIIGFESTDFAAILMLLLVVIFLPDFMIAKKFAQKKECLKYGLADFMDRTAILLDSGMPVWSALMSVVQNSDKADPFAAEMEYAVKSFSGKDNCFYRPEECLEQMADRCSVLMVSSFVSLIIQNSRKGSDELASILKAQSGTFRTEQRNTAKKRAEEASTLLLIPTALVFAAILAMVATPALLTVINGMSV